MYISAYFMPQIYSHMPRITPYIHGYCVIKVSDLQIKSDIGVLNFKKDTSTISKTLLDLSIFHDPLAK